VEVSSPIAFNIASDASIDDWAVRRANELFNVYIVRQDSTSEEMGSVLRAQSSMLATGLSVAVLGRAIDILAATAEGLTREFDVTFGQAADVQPELRLAPAPEPEPPVPPTSPSAGPSLADDVPALAAVPGYL
jgi:hypothetical protein